MTTASNTVMGPSYPRPARIKEIGLAFKGIKPPPGRRQARAIPPATPPPPRPPPPPPPPPPAAIPPLAEVRLQLVLDDLARSRARDRRDHLQAPRHLVPRQPAPRARAQLVQ